MISKVFFANISKVIFSEMNKEIGSKYSRIDQVKLVEDSLQNIWRDMICLSRAYPFKFFESCLPEILVGPFLNTLFHIIISKPFVTLSHSSFVTIVQTSKQLCENMKNIGYMFTQTGFKIYFH